MTSFLPAPSATGWKTTQWPFMFVLDTAGGSTGWVVIHAPIQSPARIAQYSQFCRRGFSFLGMTSFLNFPALDEPSTLDYTAICQGWAHCFRDPDRLLPAGVPRMLLSLSDFIDPAQITPHRYPAPADPAERFDFVYVGAHEPWKMLAKNWPLAARCLPRLCGEMGLRGLMIGQRPQRVPALPGLVVRPWLPYPDWLRILGASRFLFVPNELDASPRVLAEALCLNTPLLVNHSLLGGWKYVAPTTGVFFESEHDVVDRAWHLYRGSYRPRPFFLSQYGPQRAGRRLRILLNRIDPSLPARSSLRLGYSLDG
ncbi:glycosyltransferase family protein [Nitrococcus mobilis]|nr:hypothetical protein [Nitrococcus mobilis]